MQRTLSEHIAFLEQKIEALKKELDSPDASPMGKTEIKIGLDVAERSLVHFSESMINFLPLNFAVNAVAESNGRTADRNGEDPSSGRQPYS